MKRKVIILIPKSKYHRLLYGGGITYKLNKRAKLYIGECPKEEEVLGKKTKMFMEIIYETI